MQEKLENLIYLIGTIRSDSGKGLLHVYSISPGVASAKPVAMLLQSVCKGLAERRCVVEASGVPVSVYTQLKRPSLFSSSVS